MGDTLYASQLMAALTLLVQRLRDNASRLDVMDSEVGDGDHGSSIATLFTRAVSDIDPITDSAGSLLRSFGKSLMVHCAGASGTLYASFFAGVGSDLGNEESISLSQLAHAFRASLDKVKKLGGAEVGDATMVDAMEPFVAALSDGAKSGAPLAATLRVAADAAQRGADSTKDLVAKFGRARGFGASSQGHLDPGACSFAIVAAAIAEGVS